MRIGLIPLDERPVNNRLPEMLAAGAGVTLVRPPIHLLSQRRRPGNSAALSDWLHETAPSLDGLVVSCDQLGYGGMIAARTGHIPPAAVLGRLETLRRLRVAHPQLPIYGFSHIMRISPGPDLLEEPPYWAEFGRDLHRYSLLIDAERSGRATAEELAELSALTAAVPLQIRRDMLVRRLRNHMVHQALLHMAADDIFDLLAISVDETQDGIAAREQHWLSEWAALLDNDQRLLVCTAGDELAGLLITRLMLQLHERAPLVTVTALDAPDNSAELLSQLTPQLQALGLQPADAGRTASAEIHLILHRSSLDKRPSAAALPLLFGAVMRGQQVALADLSKPDGADVTLLQTIAQQLDLRRLGGYSAGERPTSTISCALMPAVSRLLGGPVQRAAQELLLLHRLLEDVGYRSVVRPALRHWLLTRHQSDEPSTDALQAYYCLRAEQALNSFIADLNGFARRFELVPISVQLPWRRTNEIDFELRAVQSSLPELTCLARS